MLAREGEQYRLLAHLLLDKNAESCNSAFHYDIKKYRFEHQHSLCSAPLSLTPGAWEITGTELTEEEEIKVYLSAGPDKHATISLSSALKREKESSLLRITETKESEVSADESVKT